jgi:valyl-tRNA synthetase
MTQNIPAELPRAYHAADVEQRLYDTWLKNGYFTPIIDPSRAPYIVIMPPPNVTGELHLGHALEKAIEDALIRWHRMLGDPTLWLPGSDHAGIATQWAVEQELAAQGISRHELGRERFLELVWEHVRKYGGIIHEQSRRLGVSADWTRHQFTLDPGPSKAVRTTFVNLYKKGLIYQHERIINWCIRCATALSDLEVSYQDDEGKLYHIRYPLADDSDTYVVVATTRPVTMLGDSGVAVHPEDPRYQLFLGRQVTLPIIGRNIPIVGDSAVTPEFGTGALKVTPGHDPVDFDIGQRNNLDTISVIGFDGMMTDAAGKYAGIERLEASRGVVAELEHLGLLEKVENYRHSVGRCQRCNSVLEPLISLQWFVSVGRHDQKTSIAGRAYSNVAEGHIRLVPERFSRVYLNWLQNIRDWCISRQLWWGHRIPVWYCDDCDRMTVSVEDPTQCIGCGSENLRQDPDVLDTWFSSALWPHSTLGWPEVSEEFDYFYPTTVLETGYDILFFWVARMIMLGIENTGQAPFRTVFLHGLIRDASGAKMSKTRGNTMDPLDLINRYGTDALRFALTTGTAPGNDLRLTDAKLEASRNFANKIWNAARYVMTSLEGETSLSGWYDLQGPKTRQDRWILSRLNRVIIGVNQSLGNFELGEAQQMLYDFVWNDFCDWYIEMAKIRIRSGTEPSPLPVLVHVLERMLRLLHPFMPFITEEIWQNLKTRVPQEGDLPDSVMIAPFPQSDDARQDSQAEEELSLVMRAIRAVRATRAQLRIPSGHQLEVLIEANRYMTIIEEESDLIRVFSRVEPLHIVFSNNDTGDDINGVTLLVDPLVVKIPLVGVVDLTAEHTRLRKELEACLIDLNRVRILVSNPNFRSKARPDVVENEDERLKSLQERQNRLEDILSQLGH